MVVTCMMTLVTRIGPEHQKGVITGTFRSLGALARACGPIFASSGIKVNEILVKIFLVLQFRFLKYILFSISAFWCIGSTSTYLIGALLLTLPPLILHDMHAL